MFDWISLTPQIDVAVALRGADMSRKKRSSDASMSIKDGRRKEAKGTRG